jgi:cytochrome c peroxidase
MPLDLRKPGSATPMTDSEMQDLIVFLKTLTDGFVPPAGTAESGPQAHTVAEAAAENAARNAAHKAQTP